MQTVEFYSCPFSESFIQEYLVSTHSCQAVFLGFQERTITVVTV